MMVYAKCLRRGDVLADDGSTVEQVRQQDKGHAKGRLHVVLDSGRRLDVLGDRRIEIEERTR